MYFLSSGLNIYPGSLAKRLLGSFVVINKLKFCNSVMNNVMGCMSFVYICILFEVKRLSW